MQTFLYTMLSPLCVWNLMFPLDYSSDQFCTWMSWNWELKTLKGRFFLLYGTLWSQAHTPLGQLYQPLVLLPNITTEQWLFQLYNSSTNSTDKSLGGNLSSDSWYQTGDNVGGAKGEKMASYRPWLLFSLW